MATYTYGQTPTTVQAIQSGEIQAFDSSDLLKADITFDGSGTFSFGDGSSFTVDGTATYQDTVGATATITKTDLTRTAGCCRPTGGAVVVDRDRRSASPRARPGRSAPSCGIAGRDRMRTMLPTLRRLTVANSDFVPLLTTRRVRRSSDRGELVVVVDPQTRQRRDCRARAGAVGIEHADPGGRGRSQRAGHAVAASRDAVERQHRRRRGCGAGPGPPHDAGSGHQRRADAAASTASRCCGACATSPPPATSR